MTKQEQNYVWSINELLDLEQKHVDNKFNRVNKGLTNRAEDEDVKSYDEESIQDLFDLLGNN